MRYLSVTVMDGCAGSAMNTDNDNPANDDDAEDMRSQVFMRLIECPISSRDLNS